MSEGQCVSVTVYVCVSACVHARERDARRRAGKGKRCLQRAFSLFTFIVVLPVLKAIKETVSLQKEGKKTPVFLKRVQAQCGEEEDDSDQLTAQ